LQYGFKVHKNTQLKRFSSLIQQKEIQKANFKDLISFSFIKHQLPSFTLKKSL